LSDASEGAATECRPYNLLVCTTIAGEFVAGFFSFSRTLELDLVLL
jgi:hypothetical protein